MQWPTEKLRHDLMMSVPWEQRKEFKKRVGPRSLRMWQFWVIFVGWFVGLYFFTVHLWLRLYIWGHFWGEVLTAAFCFAYTVVFTKARPLVDLPAIQREMRESGFQPCSTQTDQNQ
jgi:hypothetical protein